MLRLHTAPSGSAQTRVVQAQPASGHEADEQFDREQGDRLRAVVDVDKTGLAQRHDGQDHGHDPPAPVRAYPACAELSYDHQGDDGDDQ